MRRCASYFIAMLLLVLCAFQCDQEEQSYQVGYSTVFRIYNLSGEDVSIKWDGIEEDRNCHRLILKDQTWIVLFDSWDPQEFISPESVAKWLRLTYGDVVLYYPSDSDSLCRATDRICDFTHWGTGQDGSTQYYTVVIQPEDIDSL